MHIKNSLKTLLALASLLLIISFAGCNSDDVGGNLYTFKESTMGQYIESDTTLSEFNKLMNYTKVKGLLNAYGTYTCFAPDNIAMREFYKLKGKKSLDEFSPDSLRLIAYDHILNQVVLPTAKFPNGRLGYTSMSGRFISTLVNENREYFVNKLSRITEKDLLVHNGIIHKMDKVLDPVRTGLAEVVSKDSTFSLFYQALVVTGLVDSLYQTTDQHYHLSASEATILEDAVNTSITSERHAPTARKYGYTLLMESNATLKKYGITDIESLKEYAASVYNQVYPEDASVKNITNRANSLNRFIAYHMINKELSLNKFIYDYDTQHMFKTVDLFEYIEPMCPNTLIEVKIDRATAQGNHFNTVSSTGHFVGISPSNYDNDAANGVYHELTDILTYDADVEAELSSKRLRFDFASFFPELTNNNMRGRLSDNLVPYRNALPRGYLERFECTEQTVLCYSSAYDKYMDYMGDEVFIVVQNGKLYDFTVTTPPIPKGTYEVRFGYQSNGRRGVAQFYIDGVPSDVPVNLNKLGSDPTIGHIVPGTDPSDLSGFENDKMMRNRGYMKGPNSIKAVSPSWYQGASARYNASNLRKILGIYSFSKNQNHKISVKGLSGGQFQIDFIEFVPTSALENEDIY